MSKRRTPLESARDKAELSRLKLAAAVNTRRLDVLNRYDGVESTKHRQQPSIEITNENGVYDSTRRLLGCAKGRDLERNYSPARSIIHQMRVNVVGSDGKLRVNLPNDAGKAAQDWFNSVWAKDCDFRADLHFSDWLQNTLAGIIREGDQLTVFDDGVTEDDTGKLLTWEADQVVALSAKAFGDSEYGKKPGATQDSGIIRDKLGRELAYIATGKRGLSVVNDLKDASIYPRGLARLMCNPWRHNQGRGVPVLLTAANNFVDLYEILASELQTAKRAAKQYANVKRGDAAMDWDDPNTAPEYLPENSGKTAAEVDAEGANSTANPEAKNYERVESFTGGFTDYLAPGDSVEFPKIDRPNADLPGFIESVLGFSGGALGVASAYSKMRADTSYTAFRGDMIMTWVTFYWLQKRIERIAADWVGVRALGWAQRKQIITPLPDGWQTSLSWTWPRMPEVDELDAQNAIHAALKNGTTDYAELLGPDWRERLESLAEQVDVIRALLLPLKILESGSGNTEDNAKKPTGGNNGGPTK